MVQTRRQFRRAGASPLGQVDLSVSHPSCAPKRVLSTRPTGKASSRASGVKRKRSGKDRSTRDKRQKKSVVVTDTCATAEGENNLEQSSPPESQPNTTYGQQPSKASIAFSQDLVTKTVENCSARVEAEYKSRVPVRDAAAPQTKVVLDGNCLASQGQTADNALAVESSKPADVELVLENYRDESPETKVAVAQLSREVQPAVIKHSYLTPANQSRFPSLEPLEHAKFESVDLARAQAASVRLHAALDHSEDADVPLPPWRLGQSIVPELQLHMRDSLRANLPAITGDLPLAGGQMLPPPHLIPGFESPATAAKPGPVKREPLEAELDDLIRKHASLEYDKKQLEKEDDEMPEQQGDLDFDEEIKPEAARENYIQPSDDGNTGANINSSNASSSVGNACEGDTGKEQPSMRPNANIDDESFYEPSVNNAPSGSHGFRKSASDFASSADGSRSSNPTPVQVLALFEPVQPLQGRDEQTAAHEASDGNSETQAERQAALELVDEV